jgi:hypothetical protein
MNLRKWALPSVTRTGMNLRKRALPSVTQTATTLRKKHRQDGGTLCVNAPPGFKFECMKRAPEPNKHSLELKVKVCIEMWNCVPGNTINTVCALGHQELFTSNQNSDSILTKAIMLTAQMIRYTLPAVVHALKHHGYSTAMTRKMTQYNSMELNDLELHINTHKFPMLIVLNREYSGEQWRQHLIGIVPVNIGDEIQMHIVDGCHPNQKSIPLNEENFRWCCSGCITFYVEQFALLVPGKKDYFCSNKALQQQKWKWKSTVLSDYNNK